MTLQNRIGENRYRVEELESIENIADMAFWQLMLVEDLDHALGLIERLIVELRGRLEAIIADATNASIEDALSGVVS